LKTRNQGNPSARPLFSILTPSRNRASYLPRLAYYLKAQNYLNFEWLCGDDGSQDGTFQVASDLFNHFRLRGRVLRSELHIGKSAIDNLLIQSATGLYLIWCDSDDFLHPEALRIMARSLEFKKTGDTMPILFARTDRIESFEAESQKIEIEEAQVINSFDSVEDLQSQINLRDDLMAFPRELFRRIRFPEVDFYIPEGVVFRRFNNSPAIFIDKKLKFGDYLAAGITKGAGEIRYPRGIWFSLATEMCLNRKFSRLPSYAEFRRGVLLCRIGRHADISEMKTREIMTSRHSLWFAVKIIELFGLLVFYRDRLAKRIVKSHVDFDNNITKSYLLYQEHDISKGTGSIERGPLPIANRTLICPVEWSKTALG